MKTIATINICQADDGTRRMKVDFADGLTLGEQLGVLGQLMTASCEAAMKIGAAAGLKSDQVEKVIKAAVK